MATNGIDSIQMGNYTKVLVGLTASPTAELEDLSSVGDIADEATVVDVPAYGSKYLKKLVGSHNAGPIEIVVNLNPDSIAAPQQKLMREAYLNDTKVYVVVQMLDSNGTAGDFVEFAGYVTSGSISNEFDAVRTQTFSVAVDGPVSAIAPMNFV